MSVARALFPKGKEPRYAFEVLLSLLPEAALTFTQDGISIKALDPTKTSILDLAFYAASLEDYVLEEEVKVGLIFTTLKDVIKRIGATEKLEVEVDKERNRFNLYVYPKRGKEAGLVRRFSFPIVSVIEEEIPELSLTFDASFEVDAGIFDDLLAMVEEVSDWVQISVSPEGVTIRGVGEGGKAAEATLSQNDEALFSVSAEETVTAKYTVETLRDITGKLKSLSKRVKVELSENKPIKLTYEFTTGTFKTIVAPRAD